MTRWARPGKADFVEATNWEDFRKSAPVNVRKRGADGTLHGENEGDNGKNNKKMATEKNGVRGRFEKRGGDNNNNNNRERRLTFAEKRKEKRERLKFLQLTCFNCREKGHDVKHCPDLNGTRKEEDQEEEKEERGAVNGKEKICYKCGKEDHTTRSCTDRKVPKNSFPFALCFVCKERGHLSNQCKKNTKGCYPNGGCCKICGKVDHLVKDCPQKKLPALKGEDGEEETDYVREKGEFVLESTKDDDVDNRRSRKGDKEGGASDNTASSNDNVAANKRKEIPVKIGRKPLKVVRSAGWR
eukprot:Nk52_evm12s295 gene=Nk52_evmTU12s295